MQPLLLAIYGKTLICYASSLCPMSENRIYFKEWRKYRGLTQQQVADALGSSSGYVSDLENQKRRYNQDHLEALAELFGCATADLLAVNPLEDEDDNTDPDLKAIIDIWEYIPQQSRKAARRMSVSLAERAASKDRA